MQRHNPIRTFKNAACPLKSKYFVHNFSTLKGVEPIIPADSQKREPLNSYVGRQCCGSGIKSSHPVCRSMSMGAVKCITIMFSGSRSVYLLHSSRFAHSPSALLPMHRAISQGNFMFSPVKAAQPGGQEGSPKSGRPLTFTLGVTSVISPAHSSPNADHPTLLRLANNSMYGPTLTFSTIS